MSKVVEAQQPIEGTVFPISQVPDPVFAQEMLGPGLAIEPVGDTVVSPADGVLTLMYPTGHGFIVKADSGLELMVHIGLDTVNLKGQGFQVLAQQDSRVTAGQPLVTLDPDSVTAAGHPLTTVVVVMNDREAQLVFTPHRALEGPETFASKGAREPHLTQQKYHAPKTFRGVPVVPGMAYGPVAWTRHPLPQPIASKVLPPNERPAALALFHQASTQVAEGLKTRAEQAEGDAAEILWMTAGLARDPEWIGEAERAIKEGTPAAQATAMATDKFVTIFEQAGGELAERATDLRDVRDRVVARILGEPEPGIPVRDTPVVLFATDLSPADTAGLDPKNYLAIVTEGGGPTSHTSIIARQLGIPCIVGAQTLWDVYDGEMVLVDGRAGTITVGLSPEVAEQAVVREEELAAAVRSWRGPATLASGQTVELLSNVQDRASATIAAASQRLGQGQGVGLFRTEILFLETPREPSIARQAQVYELIFAAFAGEKVVVRTLDAGSDKPVPFATLDFEPNPALGVRGIRVASLNDRILTNQLDAIALASKESSDTEVWVMAPMISTLPEAKKFGDLCRERGLKPGIMIEVPSAAVLIDRFLKVVDFASVGTNDLAQYTMAADRTSAFVSDYADHWQPAVLSLIAQTAKAGAKAEKPIGICGEAAADPTLACVMVGMGVTSLSMAAKAIPEVGAQLGLVTLQQCQAAAEAALAADDAKQARTAARRALGLP